MRRWNIDHNKAMEYTRMGIAAREAGRTSEARAYFENAFLLESKAAAYFERSREEPLRSILYRSAATLAVDCHNFDAAEKLAYQGLLGNPPAGLMEELRAVLADATFRHHYHLKGIALGTDELQFAVDGDAVSPTPMMSTDNLLPRVRTTSKALIRTAERVRGLSFRSTDTPKAGIRRAFEVFMTGPPRPSSFAVTLKIGIPIDAEPQQEFIELRDTSDVVDEFIDCVNLVDEGEFDKLRDRIRDPVYYQNFTALMASLAPDGKEVRSVGFTSMRGGKEKGGALRRPAKDIRPVVAEAAAGLAAANAASGKSDTLIGEVRAADDTRSTGHIKLLVKERKRAVSIYVPKALMDDIVNDNWGQIVEAEVVTKGKTRELVRMSRVLDLA